MELSSKSRHQLTAPKLLEVEGKVPTVLIVDDEVIVRNLMRQVLLKEGYSVLDATGASEVAVLCQSFGDQQVDLMIVDHDLAPDKGRVVAESIVKLCPTVKVLIISGWVYKTVQEEDGLLPGSSFLKKPFTPQQLLSIVQRILFPSMQ